MSVTEVVAWWIFKMLSSFGNSTRVESSVHLRSFSVTTSKYLFSKRREATGNRFRKQDTETMGQNDYKLDAVIMIRNIQN